MHISDARAPKKTAQFIVYTVQSRREENELVLFIPRRSE